MDSVGRIVVNSANEGCLRLYTPEGVLSNANFATVQAGAPIALGPGGFWTTNIYAVAPGGDLICVDPAGQRSKVGAGFAGATHFVFGPDGALYASLFESDCIFRIAPPSPMSLRIAVVDGQANLDVFGEVGWNCRLDFAEGLGPNHWQSFTNFVLSSSPHRVVDPHPASAPARFYRGARE